MSNEEQIRPDVWAKINRVDIGLVMKLLRDSGADPRTQISKLPVSAFAKIEAKAKEEQAKIDSHRPKKAMPSSTAHGSDSAPAATLKNAGSATVHHANVIKGTVSLTHRSVKTGTARPTAAIKPARPVVIAPAVKPAEAPKPAVEMPVEAKPVAMEVKLAAKPAPQAQPAVSAVKAAEPAPAAKPAPVAKPVEEKHAAPPAPKPVVKPAPAKLQVPVRQAQPAAPAESALAGNANRPVMVSSLKHEDLKQAELKAKIFKPDAAILARIQKSKQQAAQNRYGNRSSNQQGYTGSFGRPAPAGGSRPPYHGTGSSTYHTGSSGSGRVGDHTHSGFASHSMQDAFGVARGGAPAPHSGWNGGAPASGSSGFGGGPNRGGNNQHRSSGNKNKRGGKENKIERQKEQQEAVRQNVSRVMASLSKHPVKKVYHKDNEGEESGVERKILKTSDFITVGELAGMMEQMPARVIVKCMEMGMMVTINARLDFETIQVLADEFGYEAQLMEEYEEESLGIEQDAPENLKTRHPVVTVMGHVDHGKTSLLDWIRKTHVVQGESGGITQHIGAYEVTTSVGKVTFLDTPGHEAFSAMRARGSQVTDVIVLVVAADSMVMPQTVESINLAHRENVPMVVAITKIDLPTANPDKIRAQLAERGVEVEQWGGQVSCIEVSARSGAGMDKLLETLALETEVLELKADPDARAKGAVVESKLDPGKGSMATILIQDGTLHIGDPFVCGVYSGRVRAMYNDRGGNMEEAGPSAPCQVLGFDGTPQAGDELIVVEDEKTAREIASKRRMAARERDLRARKGISLENVYEGAKNGRVSELNLIIKADVGGSAEAIASSLEKLSNSEVKINIIRKGVGAITDSDILFATTAQAIIIAFHLMPSLAVREMAQKDGIEIKTYRVIYDCIEDIKNAVEGLLKPTIREEIVGEAEIRQVFKIPHVGLIAGCMVTDGEVNRECRVHVYREGVELGKTEVQSLKRGKDDAKSVARGFECGIGLKGYENIKEGDSLMFFKDVSIARTLQDVARDEATAKEKAAADKKAAEAAEKKAAADDSSRKDA